MPISSDSQRSLLSNSSLVDTSEFVLRPNTFISRATARDYWTLLKPRVMMLVVFTGAVGYVLAPQNLHPLLGIVAILSLALGAGAAGAMNMCYERDLDYQMIRTRYRPLPQGLMHSSDALAFALICAMASLIMMWIVAGIISASLLLLGIFFYAVIYTMWLKPLTSQNIVIGGAAGAFPPIIGWTAASGHLSFDSITLFAIIFFWTPPHFWSLALYRLDDYARVGLPMLPNTHGIKTTRQYILIYTVLLVPISLLPTILDIAELLYGAIAIVLDCIFCQRAFHLLNDNDEQIAARRLFNFSIVYLFVLFTAFILDRSLMLVLDYLGTSII